MRTLITWLLILIMLLSSCSASTASTEVVESDAVFDVDRLTETITDYYYEDIPTAESDESFTVTYLGEKTVDGETWYHFSASWEAASVTITSERLVNSDMSRIYMRAQQPEDHSFIGNDIWQPCEDSLNKHIENLLEEYSKSDNKENYLASLSEEDQRYIKAEKSFHSLMSDDYGKDATSYRGLVRIVDGKTCFFSNYFDYTDDHSLILLANYALTIDGKGLYRMDVNGNYQFVKTIE